MDLLKVLRVCRIDEHAHHDNAVSRADPIPCYDVVARTIKDRRGILVLTNDLHHHEAHAGIWQRDRYRTGVEIEHCERTQCVTIGANDTLVDNRRELSAMPEFAQVARFDCLAKIDICLGTVIVVDGNRDAGAGRPRKRDRTRRPPAPRLCRLELGHLPSLPSPRWWVQRGRATILEHQLTIARPISFGLSSWTK